jgi:hypothetical protein
MAAGIIYQTFSAWDIQMVETIDSIGSSSRLGKSPQKVKQKMLLIALIN